MQIRKVFKYAILASAVAITFVACKENKTPKVKVKHNSTYEPKFRKDADGWLLNTNGDTLMVMEVEFAKTTDQIQFGMMYRKSMANNMGMLFFMPRLEQQSFWMRNTYVSLDIVYLDENRQVVSIQKYAEPLSDKSLPSEGPAQYVYEIKGGISDKIGLKKGDRLVWK